MNAHRARASLQAPRAAHLAQDVATHLAGHGATLSRLPQGWALDFGHRRTEIHVTAESLDLLAEAGDGSLLHEMQLDLAEHLAEFGGPAMLDWQGAAPRTQPPNFRLMTVERVTELTPRMRRLRLAGPELLRFDSSTALHCKLMFPPAQGQVSWPRLDPRGRYIPGHARIRKYTIRALDVAAGWMDIDFVIHHPAGPGSDWAAQARAGDRLGLIGPGGGGIRPAGAHPDAPLLLLGDETALPAIARALEAMPPGQPATAFIEIADNAERQQVSLPPDASLTWLPRDGRPYGQALVQALQDSAPDAETLVWAGCEFSAFRAMRNHLRGPLHHPRDRHLITAYWRHGVAAPDRG